MEREKRTVRLFMLAWGAFLIAAAAIVLRGDKFVSHVALNAWHTPAMDRFFALFTHLADGLVPTALAFVLLFTRGWRAFLMMGLTCGISAIIAQVMKRGPFAHLDRPAMFRDQLQGLSWVEGIDLHAHNSFPSGHTTAAFGMCLALAVILARPRLAIPFALLAVLLGYARVYLSQHFLQDVAMGSAVGTLTGAGVFWLVYLGPWSKRPWMDQRPWRGPAPSSATGHGAL